MEKELKSKFYVCIMVIDLELPFTRMSGGGRGQIRKYEDLNQQQWCQAHPDPFGLLPGFVSLAVGQVPQMGVTRWPTLHQLSQHKYS